MSEIPQGSDEGRWKTEIITPPDIERVLDGTEDHDLFQDVQVRDGSFEVPERVIDTPNHGRYSFSAFGSVQHFKERDEYGKVRFLGDRMGCAVGAIWVPHLYPFEQTDDKGLPYIRDRERLAMTVLLDPLEGQDLYPACAEISAGGQLYGSEVMPIHAMTILKTFTEFVAVGRRLVAEDVEYPELCWPTLSDYVADRMSDSGDPPVDVIIRDMSRGVMPLPEEFEAQFRPLQNRRLSRCGGNAFGTIYVPIDDLRRGIEATISFPMFKIVSGNLL